MRYKFSYLDFTLLIDVTPESDDLSKMQQWCCVVQEEGALFADDPRYFEDNCGLNAASSAADDYINRNGLKDGTVIINCE